MMLSRASLRSVEGQLVLLGLIYLGAAVLAVGALALRGVLFERWVQEKYPPLPAELKTVLEDVAQGRGTAEEFVKTIDRLARQQGGTVQPVSAARADLLQAAYGAWVEEPGLDPRGAARKVLFFGQRPSYNRARPADPGSRGRTAAWPRRCVASRGRSQR